MRNRLKNIGLILAGIAIGVCLIGPMAQAAENWLKATPSTQTFYVDGHKVDLEAYEIGGYNYVKLRDIGKAVGFNVGWDPMTNAALIVTAEPYSDESILSVPTQAHGTDYLNTITTAAREYTAEIFRKLREHGYDPRLMRLYVVGGGGSLIRHFGEYDAGRVTLNGDICATAKGYERMLEMKLRRGDAA